MVKNMQYSSRYGVGRCDLTMWTLEEEKIITYGDVLSSPISGSMFLYMFVCVYLFVCVCISLFVCVYMCAFMFVYKGVYVYIGLCYARVVCVVCYKCFF